MIDYITVTRKICGKLRPHVTFEGAEYSDYVLSRNTMLIGLNLILRFKPDDIRICKAFFEDGTDFCYLCVDRPWTRLPHSLEQIRSKCEITKELEKVTVEKGSIEINEQVRNNLLSTEELEAHFKDPNNRIRVISW